MATKISINIDLSKSKRIKHDDNSVSNQTFSKKTKKIENTSKSVKYKYRYDRIFVLLAIIFIITAISLYLIFYLPTSKDEEIVHKTPPTKPVNDIIIKEKHLSVPASIPQKPHKYLVYLYYEEINVLETFKFPIKKQSSQSQTQTQTTRLKEIIKAPSKKNDNSEPDSSHKKIKVTNRENAKEVTILLPEKTEKIIPSDKTQSEPKPDNNFVQINSKDLSRVLLVSNIYKKEPVNELSYIITGKADSAEKVYLFTQINNHIDQSIEHQWWYQGKMVHKRTFTILGKRWRCYSSKNIGKLQQGKWLIKIIDKRGNVLSTVNFLYQVE